jgi:dienelactone hydrolase
MSPVKTPASVLLIMAMAAAGCAPATESVTRPAEVRLVNPSDTDARIDTFTGAGQEHVVYFNDDVAPKSQLVVFLPGTGASGHGGANLCRCAAAEGFHVVALTYPSAVPLSVYRTSEDPDAFAKARLNIITGRGPYREFRTTEPNSIENRLTKLIRHLAAVAPGQQWDQYVTAEGVLAWDKVGLTGQSQGAGHAALMATRRKVARVVLFGGPKDHSLRLDKPAAWLAEAKATPLNRFFCFNHSEDGKNGCTYAQQLENYRAMELRPRYEIVNVDQTEPPYQRSRLLTSTRAVGNPHTAPVNDAVYQKVWVYLLTESVE